MKSPGGEALLRAKGDGIRDAYADMARWLVARAGDGCWPLDDAAAMLGDWAGRIAAKAHLDHGGELDARFIELMWFWRWSMHRLVADLPLFSDRRRIRIASRSFQTATIGCAQEWVDEQIRRHGRAA